MTIAFYIIAGLLAIAGYVIGYAVGARDGIRRVCQEFRRAFDESGSEMHAIKIDGNGELHGITDKEFLDKYGDYLEENQKKIEGAKDGKEKH